MLCTVRATTGASVWTGSKRRACLNSLTFHEPFRTIVTLALKYWSWNKCRSTADTEALRDPLQYNLYWFPEPLSQVQGLVLCSLTFSSTWGTGKRSEPCRQDLDVRSTHRQPWKIAHQLNLHVSLNNVLSTAAGHKCEVSDCGVQPSRKAVHFRDFVNRSVNCPQLYLCSFAVALLQMCCHAVISLPTHRAFKTKVHTDGPSFGQNRAEIY